MEYQDIPSKLFCLTVPKIFVEEFLTVEVISGTGNVGIRRGREYQDIPVENVLCHCAEKFRRGILYCCIISVTEKVWIGGGRGVLR